MSGRPIPTTPNEVRENLTRFQLDCGKQTQITREKTPGVLGQ